MFRILISRLTKHLSRRRKVLKDPAELNVSAVPTSAASIPTDTQHQFDRGLRYLSGGQFEQAIECLETVVSDSPEWPDAYYHLGLAQYHLERFEDASDSLTMALCFSPGMARAHFVRALIECAQGKVRDALASLDRAILNGHSTAEVHNLNGALLIQAGDVSGAAASFQKAISVDPKCASAYNNLGYVLFRDLGEYDEGAQQIEHALGLEPENLDFLCNQAMVLLHDGEYEAVLALADRILSERGDMHEVRLNRALTLLQLGRFEQGWHDYESRKLVRSNYNVRSFPCPEWQGEDLQGKTILVHGEQGLGDEIMFASCFGDVIARAAHCVIECEPRLEQLFKRSFGQATVVAGKQSAGVPAWWGDIVKVDVHIAAGSLPRHFRRSESDFPRHRGFLRPNSERVADWRERLAEAGPGLKVGISWRGGMSSTRRGLRSIDLAAWAPIFLVRSVEFVSLQYGDTSDELQCVMRDQSVKLHCWREAIDDLDECAALISGLDLVISVCTAAIHLAGAVGRPVWVLVPSSPEWRYRASGETMPWYPSARLFRQTVPGDWRRVIDEVALELRERVRAQNDPGR